MAHPTAPTSHSTPRHLLVAIGTVLLVVGSSSFAATSKPGQPTSGQKLPTKIRFIDSSSSESPAARSKRLKKECKGRPNAGACLGHTR